MTNSNTRRQEARSAATTLLLVDDHLIFLEGLRRILEGQDDLQVVGETGSIEGAIEQVQSLRPDVVLLDLGLKDGSGLEALPRILEACPEAQVIVLSGYGAENVLPALRGGARGFVSKDTASSHLLKAIRAVRRGEIWAEPQATGQLVTELFQREREREVEDSLTPREHEVLRLVGEGKRNPEIARELFISENTVKTHISSLMRKLEIEDRLQLALYAARSKAGVR
jgi:DNA-binding NarL/FixJ family response regulator